MRVSLSVLLLALVVSCPPVLGEEQDTAYKMMTISNVPYSKQEITARRFRFILPQFVEGCSDVPKESKAGDMLYVVYQKLDEAGLDESLPAVTNNLYSLTQEIVPSAKRAKVPLRCAEIWVMYLQARLKGMTTEKAQRGVSSLTRTLLGMTTKK